MGIVYNVKDLTLEQFRNFVLEEDSTQRRQIRVMEDGELFWSYYLVGAQGLSDIVCRFETFEPYVDEETSLGLNPFRDSDIEKMYNALIKARDGGWKRTYIDLW